MELLTLSCEEKIASILIHHAPANALSSQLIQELGEVLNEIEQCDDIRVIVIRGEGRFFSAGADIKEFTSVESNEAFAKLGENGQNLFNRMENFSKPIIAAIHGAALGGGLELAMACHIRLVSEHAKLGLPELQLGIIPGFGGTQRLPRYVGGARAAQMMLTSDPITGMEAVGCGLANAAYKEEELVPKTYELAHKIAQKSPRAISAVIELLDYCNTPNFSQGLKREGELFGEVFLTEDAKEGISAFLEKRTPTFKGK